MTDGFDFDDGDYRDNSTDDRLVVTATIAVAVVDTARAYYSPECTVGLYFGFDVVFSFAVAGGAGNGYCYCERADAVPAVPVAVVLGCGRCDAAVAVAAGVGVGGGAVGALMILFVTVKEGSSMDYYCSSSSLPW